MIRHNHSLRNSKPRKTDISALFSPAARSFADLHREWHELRAQASVARSAGTAEYLARRQTAILESFPQWERTAVLDRLNAPIEAEDALYAKAN